VLDRQPLDGVMKPAAASPAHAGAGPEDAMGMTILQEELPTRSAFAAPAAPPAPPAAAVGAVLDLVDAVELEEVPETASDERKELASVRPRGSSRASSLQELGSADTATRLLTLELRLRIEELPEPLRRAFEQAEIEEITLPAELRLRTSR